MSRTITVVILCCLSVCAQADETAQPPAPTDRPIASAAEYFVARHGDDRADGRSEGTALATIGKGVSLLKPGDTLTILPGHYFESVAARIAGTPERPITIRARRPGEVLLRGDVEVSGFQRAEATRYTYWVAFDKRAEGVADRANLRLYEPMLSVAEVERNLATFYQDPETTRLYVHTADSSHPDWNALTVSVTNGFGMHLAPSSHDVVIDGVAFTGYNSRDFPEGPGSQSRWGLLVDSRSERVVVRRCTSFLNSGGIFLSGPTDALVEDCYAFANSGRFLGIGGNILAWSGHNTTFRRNVVEAFCDVPTSAADITFYGGERADRKPTSGLMEYNLAIRAGQMVKGAFGKENTLETGNCVVGRGAYFFRVPDRSNLLLVNNENSAALRTYADPVSHDYRLQSNAPNQGNGPDGTDPGPFPYRDEVFFVSPTGDDAKAGTSLAAAWRTLAHAGRSAKAGHTVYVTEGIYSEALIPANSGGPGAPIRFLRRGRDKVVLDGGGRLPVGMDLTGRSNIHVKGFLVRNFTGDGICASDGEDTQIEHIIVVNCGGAGVAAGGVKGLVFRHNLLRDNQGGGLRLERSPGAFIAGNIFDRSGGVGIFADTVSTKELYSDGNAFPPAAQPSAAVAENTFSTLAVWQDATGLAPNSVSSEPGYRDADGGDFSLREDSPLIGRGPNARPIGPYLRIPLSTPVQLEHLATRAVTATTATLECWTPNAESHVDFEWGDTPDCDNSIRGPKGIFHSVGLIGLQPGTTYFLRARSEGAAETYRWAPHAAGAETGPPGTTAVPLSFETPAKDGPPRMLHVAMTGDDRHGGLSEQDAWRTVAHAASQARAGDTVVIHEGTYEELVPVLGTGDKDAPITFRAAPGETVWIEGSNLSRTTAFRLEEKHHIHIDGLRFRHFRYTGQAGGCVSIQGGSNHVIRRCFYDGRERTGYMTIFLRASNTAGLLVENCVMINGFGPGVTLSRCRNAELRHCVLYNNWVYAMDVQQWETPWNSEMLAKVSHNLICDSIPTKIGNPFFRLSHLDCLRSDHNGYFARRGPAERNLVQAFYYQGEPLGPGDGKAGYWTTGKHFLLEEVQRQTGQETGSVFGNPGIRAVKELAPPERESEEYWKNELHWDGTSFGPLDFEDFFCDPAGPFGRSAAGRPIGLDPAAFR